jgi:hypothetical protein
VTRYLKTLVPSVAAAAVIGAAQVGCYTTEQSRQQARTLTTQVTAYRDEQAKRIDRLNQEYNDAFEKLMDTLEDLTQTELQQGRDADAQGISDALIADHDSSLRGRFRAAFGKVVADQRYRINEADLAVAAVRENYAKSYTEAKLELSKLKTVLDNLRSISEENVDQLQEAARVIKIFSDSYQKARDAAANAKPATPAKPPA